jgi:hypothetical protein
MITHNTLSHSMRAVAFSLGAALLAAIAGCSGGSSVATPPKPFAGFHQTYAIAGGARTLVLKGTAGIYMAVTYTGPNTQPVTLSRTTLTIGGLALPYLAKGGLLQAGNYLGFAATGVSFDPTSMPATYNTIFGANFAGQLAIAGDGTYSWCQRSNLPTAGGICRDGTNAETGTIMVTPAGFSFSGSRGTYAMYSHNSGAVLFSISTSSLNIIALSQSSTSPRGSFSEASQMATSHDHMVTAKFTGKMLTIRALANFKGPYPYAFSNGQISFPSPNCPGGTCNGIYNKNLGVLFLAQVGNSIFLP